MDDEAVSKERYLIQESIGKGGSGQVFRAWDQHLQRPVAVKRLRTDVNTNADLRREAGILAGLHHPNIVTIYDFVADETGSFAVMEYVKGSTLEEVVARQPLSLAAFSELVNQICRGLSAAHTRGLVHLDLKAGNLMLQHHDDRSFTCKILDFGLAHLQHEIGSGDSELPVYGSPHTIAPEQLLREPTTARTDLYSLGCVFYLALSGHEPFAGKEIPDILNRHLYGEPTSLHLVAPGTPEPLSHLLTRMMARHPADRPQSAEEVRRMIQSALRAPSKLNRGRSPGPATTSAPMAPARSPAKGSGGGKIWLLVLMALVAGGFLYFRNTERTGSSPALAAPSPTASEYPSVDPLDDKNAATYNGQVVMMQGTITSVEESALFGARILGSV